MLLVIDRIDNILKIRYNGFINSQCIDYLFNKIFTF